MTTKQILELDWHEAGNQEKIQKALRMIKPLAKCSDEQIPLENIERAIKIMCCNYDMFIRSAAPDVWAGKKEIIWTVYIHDRKDLKELGKCYGCNIYEALAKSCVLLFSITRRRDKVES